MIHILSSDHRIRTGIKGYLLGYFHKYDIEKDYLLCLAHWYVSNMNISKQLGIKLLFDKALEAVMNDEGKYYFGSNFIKENEVKTRGYDIDNYNAALNLSSLFIGLENRYLFDYSELEIERGFYDIATGRYHNSLGNDIEVKHNGRFDDYKVIKKYISRGKTSPSGHISITPGHAFYYDITRINVICGIRIPEDCVDGDLRGQVAKIKTMIYGCEMKHYVEIYKRDSYWYIDLPYYCICYYVPHFPNDINTIDIYMEDLSIGPFQYEIIYTQVLVCDFDCMCIKNGLRDADIKFPFEAVRVSPMIVSLNVGDLDNHVLLLDQNMARKTYALGFCELYSSGDGLVRNIFICYDETHNEPPSLYKKYYTIDSIKHHISELYQLRYDIIRKPLGKLIKRSSVNSLIAKSQKKQITEKLMTYLLYMYNIGTIYEDKIFFTDIQRISNEDEM
jgi:hypothetical protein